MVNGVATLGKLVNRVAPFKMSTELASGVAPLANGENDGRRGTAQPSKCSSGSGPRLEPGTTSRQSTPPELHGNNGQKIGQGSL